MDHAKIAFRSPNKHSKIIWKIVRKLIRSGHIRSIEFDSIWGPSHCAPRGQDGLPHYMRMGIRMALARCLVGKTERFLGLQSTIWPLLTLQNLPKKPSRIALGLFLLTLAAFSNLFAVPKPQNPLNKNKLFLYVFTAFKRLHRIPQYPSQYAPKTPVRLFKTLPSPSQDAPKYSHDASKTPPCHSKAHPRRAPGAFKTRQVCIRHPKTPPRSL